MGKVNVTEVRMFVNGQWLRLHNKKKSNGLYEPNEGQFYTQGAWRAFWPNDGIYHNGDWYVMSESSGGITPPTPEKKVNKIRIRKADWVPTPSQGGFKFGLSIELTHTPTKNIVGNYKIKKGEKELSFEFAFSKDKVPYIRYKSDEDANFDQIKFISGSFAPTEDDQYKYEFYHKKDDIVM